MDLVHKVRWLAHAAERAALVDVVLPVVELRVGGEREEEALVGVGGEEEAVPLEVGALEGGDVAQVYRGLLGRVLGG